MRSRSVLHVRCGKLPEKKTLCGSACLSDAGSKTGDSRRKSVKKRSTLISVLTINAKPVQPTYSRLLIGTVPRKRTLMRRQAACMKLFQYNYRDTPLLTAGSILSEILLHAKTSRSPFESTSIEISCPSVNEPSRMLMARGSCMCRCIARFSGRAPYTGS